MNVLPLVIVTSGIRLNLVTDVENGDTTNLHVMPLMVIPSNRYEGTMPCANTREDLTTKDQAKRLAWLFAIAGITTITTELVPYYYGANDNGSN